MPPEEVATLKREIVKDVLDKVAALLQKMGVTHVDLANIIIEDQKSQHKNPKVSVEPTLELITPIAQITPPKPITPTPVAQNLTPVPINPFLKILSQHPTLW